MAYISDADADALAEKEEIMAEAEAFVGFRPNGYKIMARKPEMMDAISGLLKSVYAPSALDLESKALVAYMASYTSGCVFCQAHTAYWFVDHSEKIEAIWSYETNELFSDAESVMLRFTQAAVQQPSAAGEEEYEALKKHFSEDQIVDMVAMIATFGFLNRWNDTLGTALEPALKTFGEKVLAGSGWKVGKHSV